MDFFFWVLMTLGCGYLALLLVAFAMILWFAWKYRGTDARP